jgi:hypothetical protein
MPNRIVREALLESDRWLELRDNTARVCYMVCLLTADDAGNMEGTSARLRRLWRDYGIDSDDKVNRILGELSDTDLVRIYEHDSKRYLHIPRFRQFIRHVRSRHPASPWDDMSKIQRVAEKTQCGRDENEVRTHPEVKRSEVKRREEKEKRATFTPPTLDEIRAFIKEHRLSVDASKFFYHYESNGWMVGKAKLKSWQSAVHRWHHSEDRKPQQDSIPYI